MSASESSLGKLIHTSSLFEGVRVIAFNRPQKRNALSTELLNEFLAELSAASKDAAVKVIVLTGTGGFFSGKFGRRLGRNSEVYRSRHFLSTHLFPLHVFPRPAGDEPPTNHDRGPGPAQQLELICRISQRSTRLALDHVDILRTFATAWRQFGSLFWQLSKDLQYA